MTVEQFNNVKNQFILTDNDGNRYFQSYDVIIAMRTYDGKLVFDENYWDYSRTTSKHRNIFTGLTTKETKKAIKNGDIILGNLN